MLLMVWGVDVWAHQCLVLDPNGDILNEGKDIIKNLNRRSKEKQEEIKKPKQRSLGVKDRSLLITIAILTA